jgi:uncharacterized protein
VAKSGGQKSAGDEFGGSMTGIVVRFVRVGAEAEVETLLKRTAEACRARDGCLGTEVFPPIPGVQEPYVVIFRYDSNAALRAWLESQPRLELVREVEPLLDQPAVEFHFAGRRRSSGTVSTVFAYRVKGGSREDFDGWRDRINAEARKQPGFVSVESFDSVEDGLPFRVHVVRFDNRENFDLWLASNSRAALFEEVQEYVHEYQVRRIGTGFEGWFDYGRDAAKPPANWRQWLVILGALFPVIMILKALFAPLFEVLPFPLAFFLLLAVDVAVLTWVIMPQFTRLMNFWLRPAASATWWTQLGGLAILAGLMGATLAVSLILT